MALLRGLELVALHLSAVRRIVPACGLQLFNVENLAAGTLNEMKLASALMLLACAAPVSDPRTHKAAAIDCEIVMKDSPDRYSGRDSAVLCRPEGGAGKN